MRTIHHAPLVILIVMLMSVPLAATDLDEQYRPLPASGQAMWDFSLAVRDDWTRYESSAGRAYDGAFYALPSASLDVGLTDKLRLSLGGAYADYSPASATRMASSAAALGLTYRFNPGLQASLSYASTWNHLAFGFWSPSYPAYSLTAGNQVRDQVTRLSLSWLSHPSPSYHLLVPDLQGLMAPLMDPRQSFIECSLSVERSMGDLFVMDTYAGGMFDFQRQRSGGDDIWKLDVGWRFGVARGWETAVEYVHTAPYEAVMNRSSLGMGAGIPWTQVSEYRDMDAFSGELRRRWGQTLQVAAGASYDRRRATSSWNSIPVATEVRRSEWDAHAAVAAVSRPSRTGQPLSRNLDGFTAPLLDPGQLRWDGHLNWIQVDQREVNRLTGVSYRFDDPPPQWAFLNTVTAGLTGALQVFGSFSMFPRSNPAPLPDEYGHWLATVGLTYRPKPTWELRAAYDMARDYTPAQKPAVTSTLEVRQALKFGVTVVW